MWSCTQGGKFWYNLCICIIYTHPNFYFVFLPAHYRYKSESYRKIQSKIYKDAINIVDKLNISIIDINEVLFLKHPNPLSLFPPDLGNIGIAHFNELGYKLVSKTILKKIIEYEKNWENFHLILFIMNILM